jgi:hypothetical protein
MSFGRRLARVFKLLARASLRTLLVAGLLVVGALFALLRTGLGHQVLLDWGLEQIRSQVAGSLDVQTVRSGNILRNGRLVGVELRTPGGDLLLRADSIGARYDVRGILSGRTALSDIEVWGVQMDMIWTPEDEGSSLTRWIGGSDAGEGDGGDGSGFELALSDIRVHGGVFRLRRPTRLDQNGLVRVLEQDGGTLALDVGIDAARVPRITLAPREAGGTRIEVEHMSGDVGILRRVLAVQDFRADVAVVEDEVLATIEALALPAVRFAGTVTVQTSSETDRIVDLDLEARDVQAAELDWIVDWLPPFVGDARVTGTVRRGTSDFRFEGLDARWAGAPLRGSGSLRFGRTVSVGEMELTVDELPLDAVERYVPGVGGRDGTLTANVRLDGPVDRLGVLGRLTVRVPDPQGSGRVSTSADISALVSPDPSGIRIADGRSLLSPLDYRVLAPWVPGLPFQGTGSGIVEVAGTMAEGLRLQVDLRHRDPGAPESRILARGGIRAQAGIWSVDVQGDAAPLQIATVTAPFGGLPLQGAPSGAFRINGTGEELTARVEIEGEEGRLEAEARFNPGDLAAPARLEGRMDGFDVGRYLVPRRERTRLSGEFTGGVEGRGDSLRGDALLRVTDSRVRGVPVDSIRIGLHVAQGDLVLDTLRGRVGGFELDGGGRLALEAREGGGRVEEGVMDLSFASDSLMGIRPAFLGDVVHARDTLNDLDREILLLSGIDPDTLPDQADVTIQGRVAGGVTLEGALDLFSGYGEVSFEGLRYGENWLEAARFEMRGRDLPGSNAVLEAELVTDSIHLFDRDIAGSRSAGSWTAEGARLSVEVERGPEERYRAAGGARREDSAWRANLDEFGVSLGDLSYVLTAPAEVVWSDSVLAVEQFEVVREGPDPMRIRADGTVPRRGEADFTVDVDGLHLERLVRVLQLEGVDLEGHVDVDIGIQGTAGSPLIGVRIAGRELEASLFSAEQALVTVDYREQRARVDFQAVRDGLVVLDGDGVIPIAIPLWGERFRPLEEPMELDARLEAIPVAPILALIEDLEDVEGTVTGDFQVRGTPQEPEPTGLLRLADGAWTVGALGVRQDSVRGTFSLTPNGSVAVNASGRAGGRVDVSGEVRLTPPTNPGLDLNVRFQQFQAMARRDLEGTLSGEVQVTGEYVRPRIEGDLVVDRGTLYLEEFQRSVGVVDLTDPLFLGLVEGESFVVPVDRPLLAGARNPFLDSLRVDIGLELPRETWLRSNDMNVEIGGSLDMVYDRPRRDFVLIGELLAQRGQYVVLGRTFQVAGGSVEFIGIPGLNPLLDIQASSQVRRRTGETLIITATVSGTLVDPAVDLSSTEQSLAQSDLVSYLISGQPSSEFTSASGSATGANQFVQRGVQAGVNFGVGTLASQLGALAAQETSLFDYLAVTQVGGLGFGATGLADTQLEVGRYLGRGDFFGALVLRPFYAVQPLGGARLEWQPGGLYRLEAFLEDRVLRQNGYLLTELGLESQLSFGFNVFREWGY